MISRPARCALALLAASVLGASAALVAAPPAGAHSYLLETSPPNEAVVPRPPSEVRLVFSEPVDFNARSIELLDAEGRRIVTPPPRHALGEPRVALLAFPRGLPNGTYVVSWRVVSADAHAVSGGFSFSVGARSADVVARAPSASRAVGVLDAVARWLAFAGSALAVGGSFLVLALWPEGRANRRARRLLWVGIGSLLSSTLLLLQGPYATAGSVPDAFSRSLLDFTLSTRFGHALAARLVLGAVVALLLAAALYRGLRGPALAVPMALCVVGLVATWTLSDHSSTGIQTWLAVPAASVHLLAMGLWLGGLVAVLVCVLGGNMPERATVLGRFSRVGLLCFAAFAVSGIYLAWHQIGTLAALPATGFGQLLLAKSGVVLGVAVLAVTAVLVDAVPARIAYAPPLSLEVTGPAGTALAGGTVQVKVRPAKQGDNVADVYLVGRDRLLLAAGDVSGRLVPPGGLAGQRAVELRQAEPGHFVVSPMSIPYRGRWILRLDVDGAVIDAALPIR